MTRQGDPIVRVRHVRAANLCTRGARRWFLAHDLDWNSFLRVGLPASVLSALGDPLADRAVAATFAEEAADG